MAKRVFKHDILNAALSERPPAVLYHYTDQKGLLGIVRSKEIWASHHQCLNDAQEFLHAKGLIRGEIERRLESAAPDARSLLEAMRSTLSGAGMEEVNLYVAALSMDGDSLPQWRAYGGAAGFALGFSAGRLVLPEEFTLARCVYEPAEQEELAKAIVSEVEDLAAQIGAVGRRNLDMAAWAGLLGLLHNFALIFKHEKFHEEREWRIFSRVLMDIAPALPVDGNDKLDFRLGRSMLTPYRRIPLKDNRGHMPLHEVVIGPNPNKEQSRRSVQSLLNSEGGLAHVKARNSDVPYRNW